MTQQTRTCWSCKLDKPLEEFGQNKTRPLGRQYQCKVCKSTAYKAKADEAAAKAAQRYAANRGVALEKQATYYKANRDKRLAYLAEYRKKNAAELAKKRKASQWRVTRSQAQRRAALKRSFIATAPAYLAEIEGLYRFCGIFSGFEVDHIVPLKNKSVSGLHVPWNLRVIEAEANRKKKNRFDVAEWPEQGVPAHV